MLQLNNVVLFVFRHHVSGDQIAKRMQPGIYLFFESNIVFLVAVFYFFKLQVDPSEMVFSQLFDDAIDKIGTELLFFDDPVNVFAVKTTVLVIVIDII